MEKIFEWRELTEDGLLKRIEGYGPYYDRQSIGGPFRTEEEAVEALSQCLKNKIHGFDGYVLLTLYRRGR